MVLRVIGLTGPAGCGKSTIAAGCVAEWPELYTEYAFSWPIKRMLQALCGEDVRGGRPDPKWDEESFKTLNLMHEVTDRLPSVRYALQTLGTEWGRETIHNDIWLLAAEKALCAVTTPFVIVSDVRFDNEAMWVHQQGGRILEVRRTAQKPLQGPEGDHASEAGLTVQANGFILNYGTVKESCVALHEYASFLLT